MKNNINYYYNLDLEEINENGNVFSFTINNNLYYFVPFLRPNADLPEIYHICEELLKRRYLCHSFILNRDNKLLTSINEINYTMLKINDQFDKKITIADMLIFSNSFIVKEKQNKLYRNDWDTLWSEKVDYFEYQIRELGKGREVILNSFSYYIGLAENAISYVSKTKIDNKINEMDIITIAHKRIFYPNIVLNFNNPLSYILDLEVRDVAEYIKALFFSKIDVWDEIEYYFANKNLTSYSYQMFYARLLYPSYYFDMYEDILNGNKKEDELLNITDLATLYEEFLQEMYYFLSKKTKLYRIDWLIKGLN